MTGNQLKKMLRVSEISQDQAAKMLGVSRQTVNAWLGKAELNEDILLAVKTKLMVNITDNALKEPEGEMLKGANRAGTPMYDIPGTASQVEVYNDLQNEGPAFYVSIPQFKDCQFGRTIYGHSMYPTVTSGSYVFCKAVVNKHNFMPGEVYFIEYDNYGVCKRLQKGQNEDEVLLVSDNEELRDNGTRRYEDYILKFNEIRNLYLIKGQFNQSHN